MCPAAPSRSALLLHWRRIVLQQLCDGLLQVFLVLLRIFARVQSFGGIPAPDLLFFLRVIHVNDERADIDCGAGHRSRAAHAPVPPVASISDSVPLLLLID